MNQSGASLSKSKSKVTKSNKVRVCIIYCHGVRPSSTSLTLHCICGISIRRNP
ncbi:hypothetical protein GLYMA_04G252200v4 [Glycine max]|uniref:Uncharacterized protein n=2 Tax=Glycine subgen. Soja TaxID=1462606 RepID=K7KM87_SOYBN|nr:hypothetical protein JHK87_011192 [Glycine soja]KAG5050519.1 hypothetical protein JHK85_011622 [Glycine max]KAG5067574.1 hypothetical protein JHK86_011305 [Glycine max]KAH1113146.1 hypothetical protein GYH30_011056 [Glycine max]KRH64721.1 hypothetical protein GLYMA_04G252200v4 [Glycine max]